MEDIYNIIKRDVFGKMNRDVSVLVANVSVGGFQIVSFCNNKWMRVGQSITDSSSNAWLITAIAENGNVTLKVPTAITDLVKRQVLEVVAPKFLFGTHRSANNEFTMKIGNDIDVLPLCWLVENIEEQEYNSNESSKEREANIRLYFLDYSDVGEYLNEDYRLNVVSPMIALKDEFIRVIDSDRVFDGTNNRRTRPITRFGNENEKGVFENILNHDLSGVELKINIHRYRTGECKC